MKHLDEYKKVFLIGCVDWSITIISVVLSELNNNKYFVIPSLIINLVLLFYSLNKVFKKENKLK